jgi:hypothetical protein
MTGMVHDAVEAITEPDDPVAAVEALPSLTSRVAQP